jgi:asparagine synthase (glutamine-hydrolysing)
MDGAVAREIVQQHLDGKENRRLFIWSLLNVEQWLQAA